MNIAQFLPDFRPYVPGMPEPYVRRYLTHGLDEFLTRSEVWKETWDFYNDGTANEGLDWATATPELNFSTFDIYSPNSTRNADNWSTDKWLRVVKVAELYYKADKDAAPLLLPYVNRERLLQHDAGWRTTVGNKPTCWYHLRNDVGPIVGVYPRAGAAVTGAFYPTLIYSVKRQFDWETILLDSADNAVTDNKQFDIPDFIYYQYGLAIVAAAVARACTVPGQTWTNPQLAGAMMAMFEDAVVKAKSQVDAGHTDNPDKVVAYGGY